jgi:hypothetical protein
VHGWGQVTAARSYEGKWWQGGGEAERGHGRRAFRLSEPLGRRAAKAPRRGQGGGGGGSRLRGVGRFNEGIGGGAVPRLAAAGAAVLMRGVAWHGAGGGRRCFLLIIKSFGAVARRAG